MRPAIWFLSALPLLAQGAHDATVDLAIGKRVFDSQCALCHGADGSGGRGPSLRKAKLKKAPDEETLRKVISQGIEPEMPGAWQLSVREVASVGGYVRSLGKVAFEEIPGDKVRGEALFTERGCAKCHIVNGKGNSTGPELSAIGERRNAAHLRQSITDPAANVPDGFLLVEVIDAAGRTVRGVKANEDLFTIQLTMPDGTYRSLNRAALKKLNRLTGQSTMPAFDKLPANDIDNLVAYLASLRGIE